MLPDGPSDGAWRGAPVVRKETGVLYGEDVILATEAARIDDREDPLTDLLSVTEIRAPTEGS